MSTRLVTVPGDTTALQVAKMMEHGRIGAVFVKRAGGHDDAPDSIVTDRDYAVRVAVGGIARDAPVKTFASSPLVTIGPEDTVGAAAAVMREKKIRKLAVRSGNKIVGIITSTNIVNLVAEN